MDSFAVDSHFHSIFVKTESNSSENKLNEVAFDFKICYSYYCTSELQTNEMIRAKNVKMMSSPLNDLS